VALHTEKEERDKSSMLLGSLADPIHPNFVGIDPFEIKTPCH
jgi:hypothetical protein